MCLSTTKECPIFDSGHELIYNEKHSDITKSVFNCLCSYEYTEYEEHSGG